MFRSIAFVTVPTILIMLALLEVAFRTIVPASSPPMSCFDRKHGIYKFCADQGSGERTRGKLGKTAAEWRINNDGWNSAVDYENKKRAVRVAVIGDSYIDAANVDVDAAYPSLLRDALSSGYDVYRFGISGAPLSQYLNMSRYVASEFDPDVLIINLVHNDFDESVRAFNSEDRHWLLLDVSSNEEVTEVPAAMNSAHVQNSAFKRFIRSSATARYLFHNLKVEQLVRNRDHRRYAANVDLDQLKERRPILETTISYLVQKIGAENQNRRVILVLDAVRQDIYEGVAGPSELDWIHELISDVSSKNLIEFVDLTEAMKADFSANARMFNAEDDGHWNEYGHAVVCGLILEALIGDRSGC